MALVPYHSPPIMKALTSPEERNKMAQLRHVLKVRRSFFLLCSVIDDDLVPTFSNTTGWYVLQPKISNA
ncbi:hypothetical protein OH492_04195 [Vibrio chagasii]|nr:hypothetical protein [Vibrio chagasii]